MKVIMIAHNQMEFVENAIKAITLSGGLSEEDIVIVDNASEDGLRGWLEEQKKYNYIVCDEGVENYAVILNTVLREFQPEGDILILNPKYVPLSGSLQEMVNILHSQINVAAVSPATIVCGSAHGKDYMTAENYIRSKERETGHYRRQLRLEPGAALIREDALHDIGDFDERLALPSSGIMDFVFRGVCRDYQFLECEDAFFYQRTNEEGEYGDEGCGRFDSPILKKKWNMNYFNNKPNMNIVSCIQEEKQKKINILEIGCDCGANLLEIKNNYPNAGLYGVELNTAAAEITSHLAEVKICDIEDKSLDFGGIRFDYIIFGDVLEHLRDPEETVRYCKGFLKENGRVIASIPNLMHYTVMMGLVNGNFTYSDTGLLDRTHIHFFTCKEIVRMFRRQGYKVENMDAIIGQEDIEPEEERFVNSLLEISDEAEEYMFYAIQYVVTAANVKA